MRRDGLTTLISSLAALMVAAEGQSSGTPPAAVIAFRTAIRRKGMELVEAGGPDAMTAAAAALSYHAPDKVQSRRAYLAEAWADLIPQLHQEAS